MGTKGIEDDEVTLSLRKLLEMSLNFTRSDRDFRGQAESLCAKGSLELALGHGDKARELLNQANVLFQATEYKKGEADVQYRLGLLGMKERSYSEAFKSFEKALPLFDADADLDDRIAALVGMGNAKRMLGALEEAKLHLAGAAELASQNKQQSGQAELMLGLAELAYAKGEYAEAIENATSAARRAERICPSTHAEALRVQGDAELFLSMHTQAITHLNAALNLFICLHDDENTAAVHRSLADLERTLGNSTGEYQNLQNASAVYRLTDDHKSYGEVLQRIGEHEERRGDYAKSRTYYLDAAAQYALAGLPTEQAQMEKKAAVPFPSRNAIIIARIACVFVLLGLFFVTALAFGGGHLAAGSTQLQQLSAFLKEYRVDWALVVAILTLLAACLVVPEFRKILGLPK